MHTFAKSCKMVGYMCKTAGDVSGQLEIKVQLKQHFESISYPIYTW